MTETLPDKKYLLSIDGGGIRGIIPICMLIKLEEATGRSAWETFSLPARKWTGMILAASVALVQFVVLLSVSACRDDVQASAGRIGFVCNAGRGLCTMNADGSDEQKLSVLPAGYSTDVTWSPDGTKVAFSDGSDILIMAADGSGLNKITTGHRLAQSPSWSPNGRHIAFADRLALWLVNVDGSGEKLLAPSIKGGTKAAWSPDGSRIAFNGGGHVCVTQTDGSGLVRLSGVESPGFVSPVWSPDGETIAFENFREPEAELDIYLLSSDGSRVRNITKDLTSPASDPSWSPDGKRIAFVGNALDIYIVNADGSGLKRLTKSRLTEIYGGAPSWSPNGSYILFGCSKIGTPENTCVMRPDGSGLTRLDIPGEAAWLPDAEQSSVR